MISGSIPFNVHEVIINPREVKCINSVKDHYNCEMNYSIIIPIRVLTKDKNDCFDMNNEFIW